MTTNQPSGYDVVDSIAYHAKVAPQEIATRELPSGRVQTYSGLHRRVGTLAAALRRMGVAQGDRVAFLMPNSADILDVVFATWRLGGLALALNHRLSAPELSYILQDAGATLVVHDSSLGGLVAQIEAPDVATWLETNGDGRDSAFERLIAEEPDRVDERVTQRLEDPCMLMYSSGTTGRPKGVIITYGMLHFAAVGSFVPCRITETSVALAAMPLFHIAAMNVSCLPMLAVGGASIILREFDPEAVLAAISDPDLGITHFFAVPAAYNALRHHPNAASSDFSRLVTAIAGAETVPTPLIEWWADKGICIQEGYGLTETAASGCLLALDDVLRKRGATGRSTIYGTMKVMLDHTSEAAANERGEIWIKGAVVTPGYWNMPEATQEAFHDGWFRTGDIGRMDDEGYLYIEDRLKDMYISGGENVYPAEIENVLYGHDGIAEAAVIGVPDPRWGEVGCAVIAAKPGVNITKSDIDAICADRLARFKHPAHLALVEALPRNGSGKVLKHQLRKMVRDGEVRFS